MRDDPVQRPGLMRPGAKEPGAKEPGAKRPRPGSSSAARERATVTPMDSILQQIRALKAQVSDHPDVMPDERVRIEAVAWLVRTISLASALFAVPPAVVVAGALMLWLDGPRGVAATCGVIAALGIVGGFAAIRTLGFRLERRYRERVLGRAAVRELERLESANAGGAPVAVPALAESTAR